MNNKGSSYLNRFINAPDLKITSEEYPFQNFNFLDEEITASNFQFPENSIIGMQAEACFEAYLNHSKHYKLLASNLQIHTATSSGTGLARETLGELDYIVQNLKTNEIVHIELACKFYLYDNNIKTSEESKWIGPNRKDCLYDKLEKIKSKQFPLITKTETIEKLKSFSIDCPTSQQLCLKAFLFLPKGMNIKLIPNNYKQCITGYWINQSDLIKEDSDALYAIPNKKQWLLPETDIQDWLSFSEAKLEINKLLQNKKSHLIYKKTHYNLERFFVVWW